MNVKTAPPKSGSFASEYTTLDSATLVSTQQHEAEGAHVTPTLVLDGEISIEEEERLLLANILPDDDDSVLRYDADAIAAHYRQHPFQVWGRVFNIFFPFFTFGLRWWLNARLGFTEQKHRQ